MPSDNKVTITRNPYSNLSFKKENNTIVTQPVQPVAPALGANLVDIPPTPLNQEEHKKNKEELDTILSDLKEMSEYLDESIANILNNPPFIEKMRPFLHGFNNALALLILYDQVQKTNFSDLALIKMRESESTLHSFGFNINVSNLLIVNYTKLQTFPPREVIDTLFIEHQLFPNMLDYFKNVILGHSTIKSSTLTKMQGLIIDRLG